MSPRRCGRSTASRGPAAGPMIPSRASALLYVQAARRGQDAPLMQWGDLFPGDTYFIDFYDKTAQVLGALRSRARAGDLSSRAAGVWPPLDRTAIPTRPTSSTPSTRRRAGTSPGSGELVLPGLAARSGDRIGEGGGRFRGDHGGRPGSGADAGAAGHPRRAGSPEGLVLPVDVWLGGSARQR